MQMRDNNLDHKYVLHTQQQSIVETLGYLFS